MPDISMCHGGLCARKEQCYRHTAEPSEYRQAYFAKAPHHENDRHRCDYYWPNEKAGVPGRVGK